MAREDVPEDEENLRLQPYLPEATAAYKRRRRWTDGLLVVAVMSCLHALLRCHGDLASAPSTVGIELLVGVVLGAMWFQRVTALPTPHEIAFELAGDVQPEEHVS